MDGGGDFLVAQVAWLIFCAGGYALISPMPKRVIPNLRLVKQQFVTGFTFNHAALRP